MIEEWRDIIGFEGLYQVSNFGGVKSLDRQIESSRAKSGFYKRKGITLKSNVDKDGYLSYTLCKKGKCLKVKSHRLVLLCFVGSSDLPVNHINGIKDDNRLCNLEYCTTRQNETHKHTVLKDKKRFGVRKLSGGTYHARISFKGVTNYIGTFEKEDDAYAKYSEVYFLLHGEYPW
jgi:hypothetical protein